MCFKTEFYFPRRRKWGSRYFGNIAMQREWKKKYIIKRPKYYIEVYRNNMSRRILIRSPLNWSDITSDDISANQGHYSCWWYERNDIENENLALKQTTPNEFEINWNEKYSKLPKTNFFEVHTCSTQRI